MSEQLPKDLGAAANLLLVVAVLLAIVVTGVIVLVYGPLISARVEEATQTVPPAAALAPPADIGRAGHLSSPVGAEAGRRRSR
jgi:hypothetical protein